MSHIPRPINQHKAYHAHVYFDESSLDQASSLFHEAGKKFGLKVGRVHQKVIPPHTRWSCQIVFSHKVFDALIPWLNKKRNGLSILVHGLTGDDLKDHTSYAYWLGDKVELDVTVL